MVLAGLMFVQSFVVFFQAAATLSVRADEWPLHELVSPGVIGGLQMANSGILMILAFLLMANTIIGRWLVTGYGLVGMVAAIVLVAVATTTYTDVSPPPAFMLWVLILILGQGLWGLDGLSASRRTETTPGGAKTGLAARRGSRSMRASLTAAVR